MAFTRGPYVFNGGGTQFDAFAFFWNGGSDTNPATSPNTTPSWHQDSTGGGSSNAAANSGVDSDGFLYVETSGSPANGQTGEVELDENLDASSHNITVDFWTNGGDPSNRCIWRVQTNENSAGWVTRYTFTYNGTNNEAQDVWTEHNVDLTGLISHASTRIRIQVELDEDGAAGLYMLDPALDSIYIVGTDAQTLGAGMILASADKVQISSGAEDPGNFDFEESLPWGAITLALRPATGNVTTNLAPTSKFDTFTADVSVVVQNDAEIDGLTFEGDVELADVVDLDLVTIDGTLTISAAGTYTFEDCLINEVVNTSGGSVTINAIDSVITTNSGPNITINNSVPISILAQTTGGTPIENARVYIEAGSGGPLAEGTEIINDLTLVTGLVEDTFNFQSNQPIVGRVRKSSGSPFYKTSSVVGTITSDGFSATVLLILDE